MGYVITSAIAWRADNAVDALDAFSTQLLAMGERPAISDSAGRPVPPSSVLAEAARQATAPDRRLELTCALLDYLDAFVRPLGAGPPSDGGGVAGYWRDAGRAWARDFGEAPPEWLLSALDHRYLHPRPDELLRGVEDGLAQVPAGRMQTLVREFVASLSADDVVQAVAESTRVSPAARSKAQDLMQEWRRTERANGSGAASSPPKAPPSTPVKGRRP